MSYYNSKSWLYDEYKNLYFNITGTKPTEEEINFLKEFFNPYNNGGAKEIYYMSIFRLKRGWYKFLVYFLIKNAFKKSFQECENLDTLVVIHKQFAKKMLNDSIKAYCKISD